MKKVLRPETGLSTFLSDHLLETVILLGKRFDESEKMRLVEEGIRHIAPDLMERCDERRLIQPKYFYAFHDLLLS